MTQTFIFKSIYSSRSLFLILLGSLVFVLQTGDNVASSAREFVSPDTGYTPRGAKADLWTPPAIRPGIYATRLAHLWDGTSEEALNKMAAPKGDRLMLAYAPEILPQSDASRALERFNNAADIVPQPKPRPKALAAKKSGAPMALLAGFPKPAAVTLEQPAGVPQNEVKLASLAPVTMPNAAETTGTLASLNLPYKLQIASVQTGCFPEKLVGFMQTIEEKFQKKVVVTSGFRDHGRKGSLHLHCAAADILVPGVNAATLANFAKTIPGIGGVGSYCHPWMIHIDVGHRRDWNFGCGSAAKKGDAKKTADKEERES
jgi:uncharacterized protein YcbK (DUF882 family)